MHLSLNKVLRNIFVYPSTFQVANPPARKKSTAESGRPDLDFKMNKRLKEDLKAEITAEGLDYTEEEIPPVMTCAGETTLLWCINIIS